MTEITADKFVSPFRVRPPHAIEHGLHYDEILSSMKKCGWNDRPLVVIEMLKTNRWDYWAVTGSHRTYAARKLGLKIPIVILPNRFLSLKTPLRYSEFYRDAMFYCSNNGVWLYNWEKYKKAAEILSIEYSRVFFPWPEQG